MSIAHISACYPVASISSNLESILTLVFTVVGLTRLFFSWLQRKHLCPKYRTSYGYYSLKQLVIED